LEDFWRKNVHSFRIAGKAFPGSVISENVSRSGDFVNNQVSVSVVIPCFNCQDTIKRAVDSVMNQTCMPLEIILVDDGSSDSTLDVLYALQNLHGHIIQIIGLDKNYGPSRARNLAWESASGNFIAFLDSDDSWHPRKIEIQHNWMISHPDVMLTGHGCEQVSGETVGTYLLQKLCAYPVSRIKLFLTNMLLTRSVMVKRDLPFRFNETKRHSEDYLLWLETVLGGFSVWYLDLPLAYSYKAPYGDKGLSSNLWNMEKGELDTYRKLYQKELISLLVYISLVHFSIFKHIIRIVRLHWFMKV
jgi:glycosyltransferase involved in cell wall biosynthesis